MSVTKAKGRVVRRHSVTDSDTWSMHIANLVSCEKVEVLLT